MAGCGRQHVGGVAGERGVADPAPTAEQEAEMSSEF